LTTTESEICSSEYADDVSAWCRPRTVASSESNNEIRDASDCQSNNLERLHNDVHTTAGGIAARDEERERGRATGTKYHALCAVGRDERFPLRGRRAINNICDLNVVYAMHIYQKNQCISTIN